MAGLGNNVKLAVLKGMEAIGKGASNMAGNAHLKLTEINLETHRREILSELPMRALNLWQQGVKLPEPLDGMLASLSELDERLSVLRAQRYAKVADGKNKNAQEDAAQTECACPDGAVTDGASIEADTQQSADVQGGAADGTQEIIGAVQENTDAEQSDTGAEQSEVSGGEGETGDNA